MQLSELTAACSRRTAWENGHGVGTTKGSQNGKIAEPEGLLEKNSKQSAITNSAVGCVIRQGVFGFRRKYGTVDHTCDVSLEGIHTRKLVVVLGASVGELARI